MPKKQKQRDAFEQYFAHYCASEEVSGACERGVLSTDPLFTRKTLQRQARAREEEEHAQQLLEQKEFQKTCALAGLPTHSHTHSLKPKSKPKPKPKSPNKKTRQQAEAVASLMCVSERVKERVPWPFEELLRLQHYDGRWLEPLQLYQCLALPASDYFSGELSGPTPQPWEQATALAIAKMRHSYDLFESLGDAHDRAVAWIKSPTLIKLASDVIYFCEKQGFGKQPPPPPLTHSLDQPLPLPLQPPVDPYLVLMEASSITNYARVKYQETLKHEKMAATEGIAQKQIADERRVVAETCLVERVNYSKMISQVQDLQRECEVLETKCIELVTFVDKLRKELHRCVARCVDNYKNCRLHAERNDAFLELQASLAEDVPGRVGFPGWQAEGKKGYRTAVIALLSTLHDLGNARMVLREVCLTGTQINRDITAQNFEAQEFYFIVKEIQDKLPPTAEPADMFYLSWNGQDMMKYIYSSLDFLYQCPLLVKWFGTAYPWFGNPIAFCIPFEEVCKILITNNKVDEFLDRCDRQAKQACRYLLASQAKETGSKPVIDMQADAEYARKDDRIQRDDVLKCQERLDEAMQQLPAWWPKGLELSDLNRVNVLRTALLTLRVTTREYAKSNRHTIRGDRSAELCASEYGDGNQSADTVTLKKSATAPSRIVADSNGGGESSDVVAATTTRAPGQNTTVPSDFKTWLFCDDWYDNYHAQPAVVAQKKKKRLQKRESRSYTIPTRPGSTAASTTERPRTGSKSRNSSRRSSTKMKSLRSVSPTLHQPTTEHNSSPPPLSVPPSSPKPDIPEALIEESSVPSSQSDLGGDNRRQNMVELMRGESRGMKAKVKPKRRSDIKGSDIGGDIFSAIDRQESRDRNGDDTDGHPVGEVNERNIPIEDDDGDDDVLLTQASHDQVEHESGTSVGLEGGSQLLSGRGQGSFCDSEVDGRVDDLGITPTDVQEGSRTSSKRFEEHTLEENKKSREPLIEVPPVVMKENVEREALSRRSSVPVINDDDDDASVESIESLSQTVKNQNLMNAQPTITATSSRGVSANDILGGDVDRNLPKHLSKKSAKPLVAVRSKAVKAQTKKSDTGQNASHGHGREASSAPVDSKQTVQLDHEALQKEKDRKKRRKATVTERLEAARRGRSLPPDSQTGNLAQSNVDANGNSLPVILKKDTVSRVASSKASTPQQMTRRANSGTLVMPPVKRGVT